MSSIHNVADGLMLHMSINSFNIRLLLTISVALLGAALLFLGFSRTFSPPFYQSTDARFSFAGDSLQHVFNRTLGVSTIEIYSTVAVSRHSVNF